MSVTTTLEPSARRALRSWVARLGWASAKLGWTHDGVTKTDGHSHHTRMTERLSLAHIEEASRVIDPLFRESPQFADPQLSAALGREVVVKLETANPLGSFKGRGADSWSAISNLVAGLCARPGGTSARLWPTPAAAGASRSMCSSPRISMSASSRGFGRLRPTLSWSMGTRSARRRRHVSVRTPTRLVDC